MKQRLLGPGDGIAKYLDQFYGFEGYIAIVVLLRLRQLFVGYEVGMFLLEVVARRPIAPSLGDALPGPYIVSIFSQLFEKFFETVCQLYRRRVFGFRCVHSSYSLRATASPARSSHRDRQGETSKSYIQSGLSKGITVLETDDVLVPEVVGDGLAKTNIKGVVVTDASTHAGFDVHDIRSAYFLKSWLKALKTAQYPPTHHFHNRSDTDSLTSVNLVARADT